MTNALGAPRNRADGPAKVTGQADYTADKILDRVSYGVFVTSTIPSGTVTGIDISDAEAAPGVLKIFTRKDFPNLKSVSHPPAGQSQLPLRDDVVRYEGQPVALTIRWSPQRRSLSGEMGN